MEALADREMTGEKNREDVHLSREITNIDLSIENFRYEHHPKSAVFSSTAERMVRSLVLFAAVVYIEPKERLAFHGKKRDFLEMGDRKNNKRK